MTKKVTKKELVGEIKELLNILNIKKDECANICSVPNISWVSYTRINKRENLGSVLYRNHRPKLYSKDVSLNELLGIRNELESKVNK